MRTLLLLRLDNLAYTALSSRDEILRADLDFTINFSGSAFLVFTCSATSDVKRAKDIFIEAIPAPSGMVKVVREESRGQSYRRKTVGIAEASNNMRCRWAVGLLKRQRSHCTKK